MNRKLLILFSLLVALSEVTFCMNDDKAEFAAYQTEEVRKVRVFLGSMLHRYDRATEEKLVDFYTPKSKETSFEREGRISRLRYGSTENYEFQRGVGELPLSLPSESMLNPFIPKKAVTKDSKKRVLGWGKEQINALDSKVRAGIAFYSPEYKYVASRVQIGCGDEGTPVMEKKGPSRDVAIQLITRLEGVPVEGSREISPQILPQKAGAFASSIITPGTPGISLSPLKIHPDSSGKKRQRQDDVIASSSKKENKSVEVAVNMSPCAATPIVGTCELSEQDSSGKKRSREKRVGSTGLQPKRLDF